MASTGMLTPADVSDPTRRSQLPVYFLLDCSSSMQGEPLAALKTGLEQFRDEVDADPNARDRVRVRVIAFGDSAARLGGLVSIERFLLSQLIVDEGYAIGVAEGELEQLVAESLATYKHLRHLVVVDAIPRLPSGKVLRRTLRDEWSPSLVATRTES